MADVAGVTHDVTLAGQGYLLVPGSYRRTTGVGVGLARGVTAGGQFRQERWRTRCIETADGEGVWYTLGFAPALLTDRLLTMLPAGALDATIGTAGTVYGGGADVGGVQYLAADATLYCVATSGGAFSGLTVVATASATIQQVIRHKTKVYAALGMAYATWDGTTWTETATAADRLASYAGVLLRLRAGTLEWTVDETTWRAIPFYGVVNGVLAADHGLYLGGERGLYRLTGRLRPSNPTSAPHTYDQFDWSIQPLVDWSGSVSSENGRHLALYDGALYAWQGGRLWRVAGGRAEPLPLWGACHGLALAGPYLAVALHTVDDGYWLWLHDGAGWWGLAQGSGTSTKYVAPVGVAGVSDAHLVAWSQGTRYLTRWNLSPANRVWATGHATPVVALPALDGGAPEVGKRWTAVGLELGAPEGPAVLAATPATWVLDYSTDAGNTWTQALSHTPATAVTSASATIDVSARRLWLAVRCTGGGAHNPSLRTVWARWSAAAPARRRWDLAIRAADRLVTHTGGADDRTGRQIVADLAALAGAGPVTLHDLDHATTGLAATVQVVSVEETAGRIPAPPGPDATVRVILEEL
ncbi:MAG: hypothetical protein IT340_23560 [Chloroflexi bacterium]|nr:hypothetical protein [Chloroflexota bacterium]